MTGILDAKAVGNGSGIEEYSLAVRELPADLETPVSVYLKLANDGPSFLLESVTGGEQVARYSFIGVHPRRAFIFHGKQMRVESPGAGGDSVEHHVGETGPFDLLRQALQEAGAATAGPRAGLPRFSGGLVGYLGYETVRFIEPSVPLEPSADIPESIFLQADTLVAFDHAANRLVLMARGTDAGARLDEIEDRLNRPLDPQRPRLGSSRNGKHSELRSNMTGAQYMDAVKKAKEHIAAGDIFQVVLSQRLSRETNASPLSIYRALRRLNPSPYMYFFDFSGLSSAGSEPLYLIGASPEMHVRLEGRKATMRPIAGTRRRGASPEEDQALQADLLADPKERAEHTMLVDLARNDLGRVSRYGSLHVPQQMVVENYSHVMHIVSQVEGELRSGLDAFDLMQATFPAGTVSGAPKVRAMQILDDLEGAPRGPYAGAVGYFSYDGSMDTCITIRTLVMQGKQVSVQAGAGIVADSDPQSEYQETLNKARALILAVEKAEEG
jgi:anthranilate synthase component 1